MTTDSKHTRRIAPNLLARNFTATARNQVWVGDITYISTFAGRMYLAVLIDLFSRKVVGWAIAGHMRDELVLEALNMAVLRRRPTPGVIHHTDRGSQYASDDYLAALEAGGFVASMSRKGDCWDNAVAESFFASFKAELGDTFESNAIARVQVREYIEDFYNCHRLHSSLGYISPVHYEALNHTAARAA
jgi:putative transposase